MAEISKEIFLEQEGIKEKLEEIASNHGFTVDELLNVIQKESDFDSSAVNPQSSATGLIQFMPNTAKGLGTSIEEISNMSAIDQLDLVDEYFKQNHTKGQHPYITIAYPKAAKMDMDDVIAKPDDSIATQNPVWQNEDGSVTKRSILAYAGYTEDENPLRTMFDYVSSKKYYTNSYEEFEEKYSSEEEQSKLYDFLKSKKAYTNSKGEFLDKYFPITEEQQEDEQETTEVETTVEDENIPESSRLEKFYMNEGETKDDFYTRTQPSTVETVEYIDPSYMPAGGAPATTTTTTSSKTTIDGITKDKFGRYTNTNNESATEEEILRYNELEQLHSIRNQALKITSRSAGDYSDMSFEAIIEEGKQDKVESVDETELGKIDKTLDYSMENYLEYDQNELVDGWQAWLIKNNAPLIAEQEKEQLSLYESKWSDFQEKHKADIDVEVKEIEQNVLSKYKSKLEKATSQEEFDAIKNKINEEFQASVSQMQKRYADLFDDEMANNEELNAMTASHQNRLKELGETQFDQYVKNFKPKNEIFTATILDEIGEELDEKFNFQYKNGPEKKMLLQRALDGYIREMGIPDGKTLQDVKNEYWSYFYKKLAFDPTSLNEDGTPTYSQWAYKDMASGALREAEKKLVEETKNYKNILKTSPKGDRQYTITAREQALSANPDLRRILDFSQRVLDNPEEMSSSGWKNFWAGVTSLKGHEYIPILGGIIDLNDSAYFYKLAKKKQDGGELSEGENTALTMYSIKNASDQKVSELGSIAYNGGKIGGGSVSFMGEVMLTSGLYTSVKNGIQKVVKETLDKRVNKLVASQIDDVMAKGATTGRFKSSTVASMKEQAKKQINYKIKESISKPISFVFSTAAQTSVMPQRYLKGMYDNMTPEIAFAYTDQADGLIADLELNALVGSEDNPDLKDGDNVLKAFSKAFGTTWAEYATERMGELLPGLGRGMAKKIGLTSPDFLKRMSIGLVMRKMGFSTASEATDWLKRTAGYHGVFGELTEEFINMPISNLINGETWHEGFDQQSIKEMTVGIAPTVFAFSGGGVVYNTMTNKSNPAYWVDYQKHETKEAALEHLNRLKKDGKLNKDTDIEIRNDFITFDEVSLLLESEGLSNEIIKTNGSNVSEGQIVASEVEIMDEVDDPDQRKQLEDNSDKIKEKQDAINALEEFTRTKRGATEKDKEDTNKKIQDLQKEISDLKAANEVIISPIRDAIIKRKKTKAYQEGINNLRNIYAKGNRGKNKDGSEILIEATTIEEVEALTRTEVLRQSGLRQEGDKYYDLKTNKEYEMTPGDNKAIENQIKQATTSHGSFTFDQKTGKKQIVINKVAALEGGGANVAGHEFLHHFLSETLAKNPELKFALGKSLENYIYNLDARQIRDSGFRDRVLTYQQDQGTVKAMEETLNILSDAIANGTYKYNESAMTKLGDIIRRIMSSFGVAVEFGSGRDVFNFIRDYNKAFESGKLSAGFIKTMEEGAKTTGEVAAIGKEFKKQVEEAGMTVEFLEKAGVSFSKDSVEENKFNDILNQEVEASTGTKDFLSLPTDQQAEVWNEVSEQERLIIGMQLGPLWRKFIRNKADVKYENNPGWNIPDGFDPIGQETGIRGEFLDKITMGIDVKSSPKDNGLPFIVKTWNPVESKLTTHIINNLPKRIPHTARTISGFSQVTTDVTGAKDITVKPQDVILTEKVLDQYKTPLLSNLKFTKDQIKTIRAEVLTIIGTKLKALDAAMSKNQSISPMIADIKKQLYSKGGPIHKAVYEIMSADMVEMLEVNIKAINPKTKKQYTRKEAEHKAFKDSVEKFFKTPKYKKAILESLTTTWLAKHLPMGVEKKIIGIGYTTDHKGRKKGTKRGDVEAWQASEEGPYKGMTDGKQKIRRNPKAMTDITPAMLLSAFVKGQTPTEIKRKGLENISLAITQELGLEVFKADMINDGKLKEVFKNRQDLFDRILDDNFVEEFVRQSERGTTKYSIDAATEITQKTINDANRRLQNQIGKRASYDAAVEILDMKPINLQEPKGREEYMEFFLEKIVPMLSKRTLLAMSGSFTASASTLEKNWKMKFLFKDKASFSMFLDGVEQSGLRFGVNLSEQQEQDLYNAVKKEGYGNAKLKTQKKKVNDKKFKESKAAGFRLLLEMIQKDIQTNEKTIPGYALLFSSSSKFQGHFMRTGAGIDFSNTLTGKNREEHTSPITALGKYFFLHMVKGNLFTGGKNSVYDKAIKSYFQGSLPVFMDNRLKQKDANGNMIYDYSSLPPLEHLTGILNGDISIWARYFHPNVNNNFDTDFDSMSKIDIANGLDKIGGVNPNILVLANGNTIAKEFGVDVKGKITPEIAAAQQNLIYRMAIGENISAAKIKEVLDGASKSPIKSEAKKQVVLTNAINFSRSAFDKFQLQKQKGKEFVKSIKLQLKKSRGITVLDFDDTLATTKSLVKYTTPDGKTGTLNAEQYASTYEDLLDQGYAFDFSEFNKVVKGKLAPLFQKALKLQGKFGPENMFVLTARPPAAQKPIFDFLKANGLNIPLKNITGLGNSTSEAKALWIAEKVGEGYNDFYFADDALQNVQAVKNMLDQFDVKSKVQQAKINFSRDASDQFNEILEDVTGIDAGKRFSDVKARKRGASKGKFRFFIPPSHEDFVGLLYNFMGKDKQGDAHRNFFEQNLVKPLNRAYREIDTAKQAIANDYKSLNKAFPKVNKKLRKKTPDGDFSYQDAIRVYLWAKHGYDIPGLTKTDQERLVDLVTQDPALQNYAETLNVISKQDTYVSPGQGWEGGNIKIDLIDATGRVGRAQYFAEFNENADLLFSPENLNKIEAAYGKSFREALEDMLHRIKTGVNRPKGQSGQINRWMNFLNGSVGTVMFFNMRSAILQQMSIVN